MQKNSASPKWSSKPTASATSINSTQSVWYFHSKRFIYISISQWLEAFVNHGTSQIEGVAVGVQQLCQTLGPVSELHDIPQDGEAPPGNLLSDIRRLLVQHQERDEHTATLHTSVNGLVAAVQEDMRRNAEARNQISELAVVCLC